MNSEQYRRALLNTGRIVVGVRPDDLRTLDDLARFPFTTKQDLRDNYPFGLFAVPRQQVVRVHASSGTTGLCRSRLRPSGVASPPST